MKLKNIDKNLMGNVIIVISLILVFICVALIIFSSTLPSQTAEWNDMKYYIPYDSNYSVSDDSLIVTSYFPSHNLELKKSNDLSNYRKNIQESNNVISIPFNDTHSYLSNQDINYGVLVPKDKLDESLNYEIKGNAEIIEINSGNEVYGFSFISSGYR